MKQIMVVILSAVIILLNSCEKDKCPAYYSARGVGYVYDGDSIKPMANIEVVIVAALEGASGIFGLYDRDTVVTDENGKFVVPFLKCKWERGITQYSIHVNTSTLPELPYPLRWYRGNNSIMELRPGDVENKTGSMDLDTIKWCRFN